jgi:predicted DNA-binding transcriptional regulator AlpA
MNIIAQLRTDVPFGFADRAETLAILGNIGKPTLYAGMAKEPPEFPRAYKLSASKVGWKRTELRDWCAKRPQAIYTDPNTKALGHS